MKRAIVILGLILFVTGCSDKKPTPKAPPSSKYTSKARQKACMKCYRVKGKKYTPTYVSVGDTMKGISSWYGPNFHGKYTSNGEVYNMYKKTAAHKTWPMDTMVRVTNLDNGKSTVVRINDRGPFVRGRVIDCSYSAGKALGLDKSGIAKVKLEVVGFAGELEYPRVKSKSKKDSKKHIKSVKLSNFGVQVGAFSSYSSAKRVASKYNKKYPTNRTIVKKFDTSKGVIYRVWMMGFESREKAIDFRDCNGIDGSIVRL